MMKAIMLAAAVLLTFSTAPAPAVGAAAGSKECLKLGCVSKQWKSDEDYCWKTQAACVYRSFTGETACSDCSLMEEYIKDAGGVRWQQQRAQTWFPP
jgi:hypothetical protein